MRANPCDPITMTRSYAAKGYYATDVKRQPNFDVLTETYVHMVPREGKVSMKNAYAPKFKERSISNMIGLNHPYSKDVMHIGNSDLNTDPSSAQTVCRTSLI